MKFVYVPAGTFKTQLCQACKKQTVVISKPFEMSVHEVTQQQWQRVMGDRGPWVDKLNEGIGPDYPATYVNLDEVHAFLSTINAADDEFVYRLPSSAQWEYASRAGKLTMNSFGRDTTAFKAFAWYDFNTSTQGRSFAHPVGSKKANKWGIHDLHGNVAEWVSDDAINEQHVGNAGVITDPEVNDAGSNLNVARGSHFDQDAEASLSESYWELSPYAKDAKLGFRLIRKPLFQQTSSDN